MENSQKITVQMLQVLSPSKQVLSDKIYKVFSMQDDNYSRDDLLCYFSSSKLQERLKDLDDIDMRYRINCQLKFQKFLENYTAYHNNILKSILSLK